MKDQETLKTGALVSQFPDPVQDKVDNLLANRVVTTGVVVGRIFFSGHQLLRVEKLTVGSGSNLVNNSWFQVDENGSWNVFSGSGLREKRVEGIVASTDRFVRWHLTVRLDSVLQAVQFPARISNLDTGLSNVN
jgi:hypothetical protein